MTKAMLFWMIYIIAFIFSIWRDWPADRNGAFGLGGRIIEFILFGLLGWAVFGDAVR